MAPDTTPDDVIWPGICSSPYSNVARPFAAQVMEKIGMVVQAVDTKRGAEPLATLEVGDEGILGTEEGTYVVRAEVAPVTPEGVEDATGRQRRGGHPAARS